MIQVQANIVVTKKSMKIELWQLSREDANDDERTVAQAIEELVTSIADKLESDGIKVTRRRVRPTKRTKKDGNGND